VRRTPKTLLLLVAAALAGCGNLHIQRSLRLDGNAWPTFGGSELRQNVASSSIEPPLTKAWEYDASAGFSPFCALVVDSVVLVGNLQGEVHAIAVTSGKKIGYVDFGSAISGVPATDGTTMFVPLGNEEDGLVAYDFSAGAVIWKARTGAIDTSPLLHRSHVFVTTTKGKCICLKKSSGDIVWTYEIPEKAAPSFIRSSPAYEDSIVVFGCDDGFLYALRAVDGSLLWRTKTGASIVATPTLADSMVYAGSNDNIMYAVHLTTGTIAWKNDLKARIFASQAVDSLYLYVGTSGGTVFCLDRISGRTVWEFQTGSAISAAPLISDHIIYIGSLDRTLYALDAVTGKLVWKYETESRIRTTPVTYHRYLIVPLENRTVIALTSIAGL